MSLWSYTCRSYGPFKGPIQRLPNDMNPCLYNLYQRAYLGLNVIAFSTISFSEWYFKFPSRIEQMLWRIACATAESSLFIHAVAEAVGNRKRRQMKADYNYIEGYKLLFPKGVFLFWVPFVTYLAARVVIIGLAVMSLRDLPEGCYWTLPWSNFVPHGGSNSVQSLMNERVWMREAKQVPMRSTSSTRPNQRVLSLFSKGPHPATSNAFP